MRFLSFVFSCSLLVKLAVGATIGISPPTQTVPGNSSATVDVNVFGLGDGTAPSVGVYDITISYDPALLSFSTVQWGNGLDVLGLGSLQSVTEGLGTVNLFELSFDLADDLNNLQSDSFRLFTLNFATLSPGTTPIGIFTSAFGDADGAEIPATFVDGTVTVDGGTSTEVPEPSTALPLFSILALGWWRAEAREH